MEPDGPLNKRILPPAYFLVALLLMAAVWAFAPALLLFPIWLRVSGAVVFVIGFALVRWPVHLIERAGTTIKPFEPSTTLVTTGPYRFSRNPIYLGMALMLAGLGLMLGSLLSMAVVPLFVFAIDRVFIRAEEQMLDAAFGESYRTYTQRVRRWL